MLIKNTNPAFGHAGPFQVDTVNQLVREMAVSFDLWALESWNSHEWGCDMSGHDAGDRGEYLTDKFDSLRCAFLRGLEVVG
jgi:hypothetical protein